MDVWNSAEQADIIALQRGSNLTRAGFIREKNPHCGVTVRISEPAQWSDLKSKHTEKQGKATFLDEEETQTEWQFSPICRSNCFLWGQMRFSYRICIRGENSGTKEDVSRRMVGHSICLSLHFIKRDG